MDRSSGPSFKCKHLPRIYSRFNTKKTKYCNKIVNKFYISQFININNANINQYNYSNSQFTSASSEASKFGQSHVIENVNGLASTFPGCKFNKMKNNLTKEIVPINIQQTFSEENLSDLSPVTPSISIKLPSILSPQINKFPQVNLPYTKIIAPINVKDSPTESLSNFNENSKGVVLKDLTVRSPEKLQSLNVNCLMLNSSPNILSAFSKCLQFEVKGRNKKLKKKKKNANGLYSKFSSKKETPDKKLSPLFENNSLSSSGTSTPFCERKADKRNWEVSPIKLYCIDDREKSENSSKDLKSFKNSDVSLHAMNIVRRISELVLDEDCCNKEISKNLNEREGYDLHHITNYFDVDDCKSSLLNAAEYPHHGRHKSNYSDDIFESISSLDKTEIFKRECKLTKSSDAIPIYDNLQEESAINDNDFSDKEHYNSTNLPTNCKKQNKTSISTNIDSCDFHSLKSGNVFENTYDSDNSLNLTFDSAHCKENLEGKREQFLGYQNDSCSSECSTKLKVIPGKKWRRSLLAAGKRSRLTLANQSENLNASATIGWNIRSSLKPQNDYCCSSVIKSSCHPSYVQLEEITEQFSTEDKENKQTIDKFCSASFIRSDDLMSKNKDDCEVDEAEEFDFTIIIHQQVANILQNDDLNKTLLSVAPNSDDHKRYARENVLNLCGLTAPLNFSNTYSTLYFKNCKKIGEGIFGEVFSYFPPHSKVQRVLKIIPIEGNKLVNLTTQKTYSEVFSEMCIAFSLSRLKNTIDNNYTDGFCRLLRITCLKGEYPKELIALWDVYDKTRISENDSPIMFDSEQLYIALEMVHGGEPLENYQFSSARQSYSVLLQVIHSLAVAEKAFEFEHRDLHWGNILVSKTYKKRIKFMIDGITYYVTSYGKKSTIIDYTLSRIRSGNFDIYNDIGNEDLFDAYGDYQFDVYRSMRDDVKNNWQLYVPKTNIRWIHYLASKCYEGVHYKADNHIHKSYLIKIKSFRDMVLGYSSAAEIVNALNKK